jgi:hypothetical protein
MQSVFITTNVVCLNLSQASCNRYNIMSLSVTCGRSVYSPGTSVFTYTNKTEGHDMAEILLNATLNTITPPPHFLVVFKSRNMYM